MTDTNERVKALEARVAELEDLVTAAHGKADELAGYIKRMDDSYYGMMKDSLKKCGILKEFCERAGPLLLECHKLLYPERSIEVAKRLTFVMEGRDDIVN
jgi:hypothetical protein